MSLKGVEPAIVDTTSEYWKKCSSTAKRLNTLMVRGILSESLCFQIPRAKKVPKPKPSEMIVFEAHFLCGFGLPPSSFLKSVCQFYKIGLVHLKPNAIASLSVFVMLCECWLGIEPDLDHWRYFHAICRYSKQMMVHSIGFIMTPRNIRSCEDSSQLKNI